MLQVSIYRYNPEVDSAPHMQEFAFDTEGKDLMVLDVLEPHTPSRQLRR